LQTVSRYVNDAAFAISIMSPHTQQSVIVTGGSRGYGLGIAQAFVREGARVWITGRDAEKLRKAAELIGASPFVADVADGAAWELLISEIMAKTGRLDVLINNAGEGVKIGPVSDQTDDSIGRSITSNLVGAMMGCQRAAAIMQQQGSGLIVNIGSACSTHAWPGWSVYSAAKAGLLMFTRCLLTEMRPHGVRVTSVLPSWGQTDFTDAAQLPPRDPELLARCISPADMGQLILQIAQLPAHLVTEEIKLWPMVQPMNQL
jgi:NAD(P)-dependent dehydrogenase (short-subunit alcohol dehydrogenase family)